MSDSVRPRRWQPTRLPVPGILQARTLEWVAISFSNAWKWKVKVKSLSRVWLLATPWTAAYQAPPSMGFSRQEYWSGVPLPSLVHALSHSQILVLFFFFWLCRASPSMVAKNIINMTSVLTIWWCSCVESSLVSLKESVFCDQCVLLTKLW